MTRTKDEIVKDMRGGLPVYYSESPAALNITDVEADQFAQLNADVYDVLDQFFIGRATWGLSRWEAIFDVKSAPEATYEQRREVLRGKLRGSGKVSAELVENVASAYANGDVDVDVNVPGHTIIVTFVDIYGVPAQIETLKETLREIIPAHLGINYVFRFFTYDELLATGHTYGTLAATGKTYDDVYNRRL